MSCKVAVLREFFNMKKLAVFPPHGFTKKKSNSLRHLSSARKKNGLKKKFFLYTMQLAPFTAHMQSKKIFSSGGDDKG